MELEAVHALSIRRLSNIFNSLTVGGTKWGKLQRPSMGSGLSFTKNHQGGSAENYYEEKQFILNNGDDDGLLRCLLVLRVGDSHRLRLYKTNSTRLDMPSLSKT